MEDKLILIISPESWQGHFVSKHHYAITLAKQGEKVYFLNPPNDSLEDITITETAYKNLWSVSSPKVAKGLRFYPKIFKKILEKRWLEKLETIIGNFFTTVWIFENSRFYDMSFAGDRTKIYHQVDLNQNFHPTEASLSADICFCTSDFIESKLSLFTNNIQKIHHAVSSIVVKILSPIQKEFLKQRKYNIVLIGNLDIKFLDINILLKLISTFPDVTFHLIGGYSIERKIFISCQKFDNVIFWGKVESQLIPSILNYADIQLVLYRIQNTYDLEQLASPHKIMEYLSSGKVTVATYTDEYKDKRHLLEMVDSSDEYVEKFQEVLKNLAFYNSKEKKAERIHFAKEHTYEKQLLKILNHLKRYNLKL